MQMFQIHAGRRGPKLDAANGHHDDLVFALALINLAAVLVARQELKRILGESANRP